MLNFVVLGLALPDGDQPVDRDAALGGERREVLLEQLAGEPIDAGRHRGVGGEEAAGAHRLDRLVEAQPPVDPFADPFEPEEAGVALVGVEHLRVDVEGPQRPNATDAEHDLLAQPVFLVAAVEAVGDGDRLGRVRCDVGVEQVEPDPADVGTPDTGGDRDVGEVDDHFDAGRVQPERVGIDAFVAFALPAVAVEQLMEVALGVQQADADEGDAEVGRRLEMVAGEHAEAARVLRQRLGDAELGREVGDRLERGVAVGGAAGEPARPVERVIESLPGAVELLDELLVCCQRVPAGRRGSPHEVDGVLARLAPRSAVRGSVETIEETGELSVPCPVEVGGQRLDRPERFGDVADDGELTNGAHRPVTIPTLRVPLGRDVATFIAPSRTVSGPKGIGSGGRMAPGGDHVAVEIRRGPCDRCPGVLVLDEVASVGDEDRGEVVVGQDLLDRVREIVGVARARR